jgi:hypothetical protein
MPNFTRLYPWQIITQVAGVQLSCRLKPNNWIAIDRLKTELDRILGEFTPKGHFSVHHAGGWTAIGLISHKGDPFEERGLGLPYMKTPALALAPYLESIIDGFECEKRRVRLMALQPGKHIYWHYDEKTIDVDMVRLHVPLVTNPKVQFQISHEDLLWQSGELWYGDFSFPHRLFNGGPAERIHLVMDLMVNDYVTSLFPRAFLEQREKRLRARKWCKETFRIYNLSYTPKRLATNYRQIGLRGIVRRLARRLA